MTAQQTLPTPEEIIMVSTPGNEALVLAMLRIASALERAYPSASDQADLASQANHWANVAAGQDVELANLRADNERLREVMVEAGEFAEAWMHGLRPSERGAYDRLVTAIARALAGEQRT